MAFPCRKCLQPPRKGGRAVRWCERHQRTRNHQFSSVVTPADGARAGQCKRRGFRHVRAWNTPRFERLHEWPKTVKDHRDAVTPSTGENRVDALADQGQRNHKSGYERAALHSSTSSAVESSRSGILRPSAFAVLRLTASSYLIRFCTGRLAGFSPLRMRST